MGQYKAQMAPQNAEKVARVALYKVEKPHVPLQEGTPETKAAWAEAMGAVEVQQS